MLLGIPDTAALNIINVNIDLIEAEGTQEENCNTNISDAKTYYVKQEMHEAKESCTNTEEDLKMQTMPMGWIVILIQTH